MKPFLKWAGGKRWLADTIAGIPPPEFRCYHEPFVGSGAVFFRLQPTKAKLSDSNAELINAYKAICDAPDAVREGLARLHHAHSHATYYSVRANNSLTGVEAAVRFIYLNRTCWNGLYRVNRQNRFNVPIGTKSSVLFADDDFEKLSRLLKAVELYAGDFQKAIDRASAGDLLFVDPPYTVQHNRNGFLKYNQTIFSWDDQVRLHDTLVRARDRGCHIVMSNADHDSIRELYQDFGEPLSVPRSSVIAGDPKARTPTTELLLVHHA